MAPKIDSWMYGYVTVLFQEKYSHKRITSIKLCKSREYGISKKGTLIYRISEIKAKSSRFFSERKPS